MLSSPDWKLTLVTNHKKYPCNQKVSLQCPTAEYPCSAQPKYPSVPKRRVSQQCPTAKYPYTAQPQSIPAVPQLQSVLAVPNRRVSLQCPTAKYPCSAQLRSTPAMSNHQSAQPQSIPGVPNSRVSIFLQRICSAARKTVEGGQGKRYTSSAITALRWGCSK